MDLMEVRRLFLSDMIKLFSNSRENRRWGSLPFSPFPPWQQLTAWWTDQKKEWRSPLLLCLMGTPVMLNNPVLLSQQMFQWHIRVHTSFAAVLWLLVFLFFSSKPYATCSSVPSQVWQSISRPVCAEILLLRFIISIIKFYSEPLRTERKKLFRLDEVIMFPKCFSETSVNSRF